MNEFESRRKLLRALLSNQGTPVFPQTMFQALPDFAFSFSPTLQKYGFLENGF